MNKDFYRQTMGERFRLFKVQENYKSTVQRVLSRLKSYFLVHPCSSLGLYWPVGFYEIDIRPFFQELLQKNKKILLPYSFSQSRTLKFFPYSGDPLTLEKDDEGILSPRFANAKEEFPQLLILPCLAFNDEGYRLGSGKGYYDRYLKNVSRETSFLNLGFEIQKNNEFPLDLTDVPCHGNFTELGFRESKSVSVSKV